MSYLKLTTTLIILFAVVFYSNLLLASELVTEAGLLVTLRADKPIWLVGEVPTFKAAINNNGKLEFAVTRTQELYEVEINGQWYRWEGAIDAKSSALRPGDYWVNITLALDNHWREKNTGKALELKPGKHTVRIALLFNPTAFEKAKPLRVISNALEIDKLPGGEGTLEEQSKNFEQEMALCNKAIDGNEKIKHLRKALAARPNHPDNIAAEFELALQLRQIDSEIDMTKRNEEAKSIYNGILKKYSHMRYYTSRGPDSPFSPQVLVPRAAMAAIRTDYLKIHGLSLMAMRCLQQTHNRRVKDWTDEPKPSFDEDNLLGGPLEKAKWEGRVLAWEERRHNAIAGKVLNHIELDIAERAVKIFALSSVFEGPEAVDEALRRVTYDFPGSPMAHFAEEELERRQVERAAGENWLHQREIERAAAKVEKQQQEDSSSSPEKVEVF